MNESEALEQRLNELYQRSLKGDSDAFREAVQLATNALKNVQQVKSKPAEMLRQKLEHFLAQLKSAGAADSLRSAKDAKEVQREDLHAQILAGDVTALDRAALTAFGHGVLDIDGRKAAGSLGIVFQCALIFVEGTGAARKLHILARPGELKAVGTKGFLKKQTILAQTDGKQFAFALDKKKSTVDEIKRLESLGTLWKGLGL